jgi:nicotinate-nucleotide adenylyltransferase
MTQDQQRGGRIAFFGGSFDPPHFGHLAVARAARRALSLDAVLFAPVGAQPLKPSGSSAGFEDRMAMTRLAIAGEPGFSLSLVDAPKAGGAPNYTLESLLFLSDQLPPGGQLFCLMGADAFAGLHRWHRAAEIPFAAPLIVASRPGESIDDLASLLPEGFFLEPAPAEVFSGVELVAYRLRNSRGRSAPFYLLPGLAVDISATQIRAVIQRPRADDPRQDQPLLPPAVLEYIRSHGLYR